MYTHDSSQQNQMSEKLFNITITLCCNKTTSKTEYSKSVQTNWQVKKLTRQKVLLLLFHNLRFHNHMYQLFCTTFVYIYNAYQCFVVYSRLIFKNGIETSPCMKLVFNQILIASLLIENMFCTRIYFYRQSFHSNVIYKNVQCCISIISLSLW